MYQSSINVRYAKSLFLLGVEKNLLDEIKRDIDLLLEILRSSDELRIMLEHPVIRTSKKSELISQLFTKSIHPYSMSFLQLIIKNKRENHLNRMTIHFVDLYRKHKGIKTAVLTTAHQIADQEKENIKKAIEKRFKATIEFKEKINEELIGGMIIQVDDKQLDLSVAKQIQILRDNFSKINFNNKKNI